MRIYLAAPWTHRQELPTIATAVTQIGYTITHDWWNHDMPDNNLFGLRQCAENDFTAVATADVFGLLNFEKSEGKSVETGVALAYGKRMVGVGPRYSNIFHYLPQWEWVPDIPALLDKLQILKTLRKTG